MFELTHAIVIINIFIIYHINTNNIVYKETPSLFSGDTFTGPQKIHYGQIPRIGGLVILYV